MANGRPADAPSICIDDGQPSEMRSLPNSLWVHAARLTTGRSHAHHYRIAGEILGDKRFDTAAYTDDSYPQPGVQQGRLSEQLVYESQVYRGWKISYWVYASPELTRTPRRQSWSGRMAAPRRSSRGAPACAPLWRVETNLDSMGDATGAAASSEFEL